MFVVDKKIKMREKHFSGLTSVKCEDHHTEQEQRKSKHNTKTEGVSVADIDRFNIAVLLWRFKCFIMTYLVISSIFCDRS